MRTAIPGLAGACKGNKDSGSEVENVGLVKDDSR
jgi:hypothetical protein